jgi:etoposide-induced 2.4 mRNA
MACLTMILVYVNYSDVEIRSNVFKSLLLNCSTLTCLYVFGLFFFDKQQWLRPNVGWIYQLLWVLPVVGISFYLNVRYEVSLLWYEF